MLFRQLFDPASSTYTYLIAADNGSEAVIIDPVIDRVTQYLELCKELNLKLRMTIDTHTHADHITGSGSLLEATGCKVVMGEATQAQFVSHRVQDGEVLEVGTLRLLALSTPGHTPDSFCFFLGDRVFTGDTLLIRGTGRTDFQNGDPAQQYHSIYEKLLTLPPKTLVYPGHDYRGMTVSTIEEEQRYNPRLQCTSTAAYIELMENLNLPLPKMMEIAVPVNLRCGLNIEK